MTSKINYSFLLVLLFAANSFAFNIAPTPAPGTVQKSADSIKKQGSGIKPADTSAKPTSNLPIDTSMNKSPQQTIVPVVPSDTVKKIDSTLIEPVPENALTNTKLFIYILLSVLGLILFFYIFVLTLFKTFHKKKSTRQSLLLSWNLFFIVTLLWIFIIWGLVAGFWTVASFMIVVIFLFIISLIMTIIALKSK